ncbi:MAG: DASS family sodium-coupled anion symporter [Desulfurobacteriaceae bacterium]
MKKWLGVGIALLLLTSLFLSDLPVEVKKGLSVLSVAASFWIFEVIPLPVTSLLISVLSVLLGIVSVKSAFAAFAHPLIFLFFGGFALATALTKYGLDKFIAYKIVSLSRGSLLLTSILLFTATAFISMWISNTSTTAIMLPLALGILGAVGAGRRMRSFLLLGIAYSASIGGIGTIVGSPPNGITAANLGIDFTEWMRFGLPTVILLLPLMFAVMLLYFRPKLKGNISFEKISFPKERGSLSVLGVFILTVALWLFGKKIALLFGIHKYFDAMVAVLAVILLFALKLVSWEEIEKGTDWGTLMLFGGGITLSHILKVSKASKFIASAFVSSVGFLPPLLVVLSVTAFMIFMTELMSNTATAAIFIPILIAAAKGMELPPQELAVPAGIAASCAFMLPVATPPNAIVYGTGEIKQSDMIKVGLIMNLTFSLAIALLCYFLINGLL